VRTSVSLTAQNVVCCPGHPPGRIGLRCCDSRAVSGVCRTQSDPTTLRVTLALAKPPSAASPYPARVQPSRALYATLEIPRFGSESDRRGLTGPSPVWSTALVYPRRLGGGNAGRGPMIPRLRRALLVWMCTAACCLALTSVAAGASFGLGDQGLAAYGDSSSFHTLCGWNGASCGHGGLNIRYTRAVFAYNALGTYDSASGGCISTAADPNNWVWDNGAQAPTSQAVQRWMTEAQKDGLQPLVAITWGNGHLTGEADNPRHPTANAYRCGLEALMTAYPWVHSWETFNEPEQGLCASDAANFFSVAQQAAAAEGRSTDTLVAGAFAANDDPLDQTNHPDCGHRSGDWFIPDYVKAINAKALQPAVWSWHPYDDVDASYTGTSTWHQTGDTVSYLNQKFASHPSYWITEAGVVLNSSLYGKDLDGNPTAQANAALGFKNLANAPNQAFPGQIARIYWYEFQTYGDGASTGSDSWDSSLLGLINPDWAEDGTGVPRSSYCVLAFGDTPAQAISDSRCNYANSPHTPWSDWQDPSG